MWLSEEKETVNSTMKSTPPQHNYGGTHRRQCRRWWSHWYHNSLGVCRPPREPGMASQHRCSWLGWHGNSWGWDMSRRWGRREWESIINLKVFSQSFGQREVRLKERYTEIFYYLLIRGDRTCWRLIWFFC